MKIYVFIYQNKKMVQIELWNISISGPVGQEMIAFWQAFQKLRTDGQTKRHFMYIDWQKYGEQYGPFLKRL